MKRRRLLLFLAVLFLGGIIFAVTRGPAEPEYQGKKLSAWIEAVDRYPTDILDTNALLSLRAIGSNAIPWLLAELDVRDGAIKRFNDFTQRKWNFHLGKPGTPVGLRHFRAVRGFQSLGPWVRGAIPQLVERLGKEREVFRSDIQLALVGIASPKVSIGSSKTMVGPGLAWIETERAATELPAIRQDIIDRVRPIATGAYLYPRWWALQVLRELDSDTAEAVPFFLHALQSTDATERARGARCLGVLAKDPLPVIPALMEALNDPSPEVQLAAARALGNYFRQARTAVPALRKLATNSVPFVQQTAAEALHKIEGTAEADLKCAR